MSFFIKFVKKNKLSDIVFTLIIISLTIHKSPILFDRYLKQTKIKFHLILKKIIFFQILFFMKIFIKQHYNGFLDKKYFGQGARSFRFFLL